MKNTSTFLLLVLFFTSLCGQSNFSSEDLQSDTRLLWDALNELHPGIYRHTDTAKLEKNYQDLLNTFSQDQSANETFLYLSEFIAGLKCGHTYINPFNQKNKIISNALNEKALLPFTFRIIDKKIVIDKPFTKKIKEKDVVTHINGMEVASILDQLKKYIKADGDRDQKRLKDLEIQLTSKYEYFDYYFPMVYQLKDEVNITLNDGKKQVIPLLTKKERSDIYSKSYPNANLSNYDDLWNKEFHENHAYLRLGTFVTWKMTFDWEKYLDTFFDELNSKSISNLVIDVRGNEGGLTEVTNYLIKKLAKKKGKTVFRKPHLAYKKVSEHLKPHVSTWSKWFYNTSLWTKKMNDNYRTIRFSANRSKKIKKNKKAFTGETYLLVDEANSSATFILAEICKKNNYATLVGTETGGTKKGITAGQIFFLTLPNTQIEVDIPLIGRYPMENLPDEGIEPDIQVKQSLSAYVQNRDQVMEKVKGIVGN